MRHPYRLPALVFAAGVLVVLAAWLWEAGRAAPEEPAAPSAERASSATAPQAPVAPALSGARLRNALIGKGDLGRDWHPTDGAATWRDGLLKGSADRPECQRLLDAVYAENLLGEPSGATVVAGFDDTEHGAQVRYQVGAYRREQIDARLGQVAELAEQCGEFTATVASGRTYDVRVRPVGLPGIGDASQALRMTVRGEVEGERGVLTLDVAALRVGDGAALLTHGGLYGIDADTTRQAAQLGAQRLQDTLAGRPPHASGREQGHEQGEGQGREQGHEQGEGQEQEQEQGQEQEQEQEQEQGQEQGQGQGQEQEQEQE